MKGQLCSLILVLVLTLALLLSACSQPPVETTSPEPSTEPISTTAPTTPTLTPQELYQAAKESQYSELKLTVTHKTDRTIRGQTYTALRKANVIYTNYHSDKMAAISHQTINFGSYVTSTTEQFIDGKAYLSIADNSHAFFTEMSYQDYVARQLPVALLDLRNYQTITVTEGEGTFVLTFSTPSCLESWVTADTNAVLISAGGNATIQADGTLTGSSYQADYQIGDIVYRVEASVVVEAPTAGDSVPSAPSQVFQIDNLDAPLMVLQAIGDLNTSESISACAQELLVANAAALVRTSQTDINLCGTGSAFMAKVESSVSVTNYTGQTTSSTQTELFRNGVYTFSFDGGTPTTEPGVTAAIMRNGCNNLLLSYLLDVSSIQGITVTDTGDFYLLELVGTTQYYVDMEDWINKLIGVKLSDYATASATKARDTYLAINKVTGLPTSMSLHFAYTHTIEGVTYDLTYDCTQSIQLSSNTAYKAITGSLASESQPANTATPLFYKVTSPSGKTLWLLGTIHVGDERTAYLPKEIYDALDASDALAVEMDVNAFEERLKTDTALQQQISEGYYFSGNTTVSSLLTPEQYQTAKNLMIISGNYLSTTEWLKPALWENTISNFLLNQSSSLISDKGVDQRLMDIATGASKPIFDIEDPVSHMLMITNYSIALQNYLLMGTVETSLKDYYQGITDLYELWCKGDVEALTEAVAENNGEFTEEEAQLYAEYTKAMMTDRNQIMLQKVQEYLDSDLTVFFAVGLAHVLGEDGLVALLQDAGYTVSVVSYN